MERNELRIVYMGTPDFAVAPLKALTEGGFNVVAVVTMPDKPAGRGMKLQASPVKQFALEVGIPVLQPEKLKEEAFLDTLRSYRADLQIVVAFRMLPEVVWAMPALGTFNLHASLLPQYRGAAPIHRAVMNGDRRTGVTTFFLQHEIDTGDLLLQKSIEIGPEEDTGSVHDRLMELGAGVVCETVDAILTGNVHPIPQPAGVWKPAPKLFRENTRIDWTRPASELHDFIRGLSPFPAAWTELEDADGQRTGMKVFASRTMSLAEKSVPGTIITDGKQEVMVATGDGILRLERFQLAGRKAMTASEFLRGFAGLDRFRLV